MWGTVSCPAGNNVAWLKCETFDTCKISATSYQGMYVDASYWGVQGWEATTSASDLYGSCFAAGPSSSGSPSEVHHIIFANNVANGCSDYGFFVSPQSSYSADYVAFVGNIAYNAAQSTTWCASGFSIYEPKNSDTVAGTHYFFAGNFSYENFDGNCNNGGYTNQGPTDGEGIILDTLNEFSYSGQIVIENNMTFLNGGRGIQENTSASAPVYIKSNTVYGNNGDNNEKYEYCGDIAIGNSTYDAQETNNIVATNSSSGCGDETPVYAIAVINSSTSSDVVNDNWIYGVGGYNTTSFGSSAFSFGSGNVLGTSPTFVNPVNPGAPSCSGTANVPGCMAKVIADFQPTAPGASAYGYQTPGTTSVYDPLYPQWLCNVGLPAGLVTPGCSAQ
jgi:hypothetical protein